MHLKKRKTVSKKLTVAVGAPGFEPGTSCTPCKHASRTALRPEQQALIIPKPPKKCKFFSVWLFSGLFQLLLQLLLLRFA